jgi:dTDP-4-dehydrorhamnose 3,5-epimerase
MPRQIISEIIAGVVTVVPDVHSDERGIFVETYRRSWVPNSKEMVQGNRANRQFNSVVGLHYHLHQADFWYVPFGSCRIVLHDIRTNSPTHGNTIMLDVGLKADGRHDHSSVYIPPGVAHGFAALSDMTITYLVDSYYNPNDELGVAWDDPTIGAIWGLEKPILSSRDLANPKISEIPEYLIPRYR